MLKKIFVLMVPLFLSPLMFGMRMIMTPAQRIKNIQIQLYNVKKARRAAAGRTNPEIVQ